MSASVLSGESVICVSWLDWDWLPLVPHQMMTRLAQHNRVLFVDPAIALSTFIAHPRQFSKLTTKLRRWMQGPRQVSENLYIYYPPPLFVSPGHLPSNDALNRRWLGWVIKRTAARLGLHEPILWLYDPYLIEPNGQFGEKLVCYDCNDDTSSFASLDYKQRNMRNSDDRVTERADLVLATSRELYRRKRTLNDNVHYLPSGVDFELFNSARDPGLAPSDDLAAIPGPVIAYVGSMTNYRIEWEWIEALARGMPEATIVLIGPLIEPAPEAVARLANVRFVGPKPPAELPRYLKLCHVGIVPYKGEDFLKACQPTKTFEYLAAGLGVVSAPIPDLEPYAEVVRFAASPAAFVQKTREMLELAGNQVFRDRCVEIARGQTWNARVMAVSKLVRAALDKKAAASLAPGASTQ
jgi:glycosyltransferase involved in cell wall biosynthesis